MKLRLELEVRNPGFHISHHDKLLLIGSCFTENIGNKFTQLKFNNLQNPHGILFNPVSVCKAIKEYVNKPLYTAHNLFYYNEAWHSWNHHSRFSAPIAESAVDKINDSTNTAHEYLKNADYLFVTFGSAWVYTFTEEAQSAVAGEVASNNHKAPGNWFTKRLLTSPETVEMIKDMMLAVLSINPSIKFIYTISPVRHLREGLIENNRSKAVLIDAVHSVVNSHEENCFYFPSYEIVIDDLRDYRFYSEDMVHPNYLASDYVWDKMVKAYMKEETIQLNKAIEEMNIAYKHKPFNETSNQHQTFLKSCLNKVSALKEQYPHLDFQKEIAYFNRE